MEYQVKLYWELNDQELEAVYGLSLHENILAGLPFEAGLSATHFCLFAKRVEVFGVVYGVDLSTKALFFLTNFEGNTARFHLRLFSGSGGDKNEPQLLPKWVGDWCFKHFEFRSLTLLIPSVGTESSCLGLDMGGHHLGEIPGACWIKDIKRTVPGDLFVVVPGQYN